MVQGWANLRHGREVVDELGLSKSKPVSSPATADGAARCQDDEFKPLNEEEKRLYQRIAAKLNYLAHDRLELQLLVWQVLSKRVGRYLRRAPVAWQGFSFHDPRPGELLCYTDADWASDKTSRRSTSGGVVTPRGGVLNCWRRNRRVSHCQAGRVSCSQPSLRARDHGDPERVGGSWVQMQCHSCDRQSESH